MHSVAVVILNFRRADDTLDCLRSVRASSYRLVRIVVVDNGSGDGSLERIRSADPDASLIELPENRGFGEGNNAAIRSLPPGEYDYILLLNNDATVARDTIEILVGRLAGDPSCAIVGPKIMYHDHPSVVWSAGGSLNLLTGTVRHHGIDRRDGPEWNTARECDFLSGCCFLIRRPLLEQLGLLPDLYFAYYEDAELCLRTRKAGYRLMYEPRAVVYHKVSASSGWDTPAYLYLTMRNRLLFLSRNAVPLTRVVSFPVLLWYYVRQFARLLLKWRDIAGIHAAWMGVMDGLAGRTGHLGKGRLDNVRPAQSKRRGAHATP